MPIFMTASWTCKPGAESTVEGALREFVDAVRENEPDTRIYVALQSSEDPRSFLTYFIFENEEAQVFHRGTDWVKRFTETIYPENVGDVTFTEYQMIASTQE